MKLTINGQEVEIKVKDSNGKYNPEATVFFLNDISLHFNYAETYLNCQGYQASANRAGKIGHDIFNALNEAGAYNKV